MFKTLQVVKALTGQVDALKAEKEQEQARLRDDFERLLERVTGEFERDTEEQLQAAKIAFEGHRTAFIKTLSEAEEGRKKAEARVEEVEGKQSKILILLDNMFKEYKTLEADYGGEIENLEAGMAAKDTEILDMKAQIQEMERKMNAAKEENDKEIAAVRERVRTFSDL